MNKTVVLGHIAGAHGVKGWVRIHSHTEPRESILEYQPWLVGEARRPVAVEQGSRHGKTVIARLEGVESRDDAEALVGETIQVSREAFPELREGQYYWADLVGLEVYNHEGERFGVIHQMLATGANDVMVVRGDKERLVPFVYGQSVLKVDLDAGQVVVDWDATF